MWKFTRVEDLLFVLDVGAERAATTRRRLSDGFKSWNWALRYWQCQTFGRENQRDRLGAHFRIMDEEVARRWDFFRISAQSKLNIACHRCRRYKLRCVVADSEDFPQYFGASWKNCLARNRLFFCCVGCLGHL